MIYFLGVISVFILFFIAAIHVYWAFGGKLWVDSVIPTKEGEERLVKPPVIATLIVAVVLSFFALLYANKIDFILTSFLPIWLKNYGVYIVASIFILRAIGEFNYVGFFKRVKNTRFAKSDTNFFSPLCMFLGVVGFLIEVVL